MTASALPSTQPTLQSSWKQIYRREGAVHGIGLAAITEMDSAPRGVGEPPEPALALTALGTLLYIARQIPSGLLGPKDERSAWPGHGGGLLNDTRLRKVIEPGRRRPEEELRFVDRLDAQEADVQSQPETIVRRG